MGFGQAIQKSVLALQHANDWRAKLGFEAAHHAEQQRSGQTNHVRVGLGFEPGGEFIQLARLVAVLAAQHGKGQLAQVLGSGLGRLTGRPFQQAVRGQKVMEPAWRLAEEGGLLFQINVDAAEEDGRACALIGFIQRERQVKRNHHDLMAQGAEFSDQGVVAEAQPAIHRTGAGSKLNDVHDREPSLKRLNLSRVEAVAPRIRHHSGRLRKADCRHERISDRQLPRQRDEFRDAPPKLRKVFVHITRKTIRDLARCVRIFVSQFTEAEFWIVKRIDQLAHVFDAAA